MKTAIPFESISKMLEELMARAVSNGANSVSMPDEYVAVAHFLSFPHEYTLQPEYLKDLMNKADAYVETRHTQGHRSYNENTHAARVTLEQAAAALAGS